MSFKKKETTKKDENEKKSEMLKKEDAPSVVNKKDENTQNPRLSCTISYKGLIVGGNDYHPEKLDMSHTITIDHIPGETVEQTQARLDDLKVTQELLITSIQKSIAERVGVVKEKMLKLKQEKSGA